MHHTDPEHVERQSPANELAQPIFRDVRNIRVDLT